MTTLCRATECRSHQKYLNTQFYYISSSIFRSTLSYKTSFNHSTLFSDAFIDLSVMLEGRHLLRFFQSCVLQWEVGPDQDCPSWHCHQLRIYFLIKRKYQCQASQANYYLLSKKKCQTKVESPLYKNLDEYFSMPRLSSVTVMHFILVFWSSHLISR